MLRGDGRGGFTPIALPSRPIWYTPVAADLDADGDLDLAGISFPGLTVLRQDAGRFESRMDFPVDIPAPGGLLGVLAADWNGDRRIDLAGVAQNIIFTLANETLSPESADQDRNGVPDECEAVPRFLRGDCDGDGIAAGQVTDAVFLLNHNFLGGPRPSCLAACDANGDGRVLGEVTDAVFLLTHSFLGGPAPALPFPECGPAALESDMVLGCAEPPGHCR